MSTSAQSHSRSHSLLLLQKLLNVRDAASPLTLVLDSLEQPARPILRDISLRAKIARTKVIFVSFSTFKRPQNADVFIKAAEKDLKTVRRELLAAYPAHNAAEAPSGKPPQRVAVLIDSLNSLASSAPQSLASFLSSVITPASSIIAIYHTDVPIILPSSFNEYEPHPFTVLCHLATAILKISSLQQEIERQKARNRSVVEPEWGLKEDRQGVLVGLVEKSQGPDRRGVVIRMELRRRSGRTVSETFVLVPTTTSAAAATQPRAVGKLFLLADHSMFASPQATTGAEDEDGEPESTFNLGLTEKQRKDREGIVLPYFDAQTDVGAGEGGRILYEMGREDDFDDEEDEI